MMMNGAALKATAAGDNSAKKSYYALISKIAPHMDFTTLKQAVSMKVGGFLGAQMYLDELGVPTGCARFEFETHEELIKCIRRMNNQYYCGSQIQVTDDTAAVRDIHGRIPGVNADSIYKKPVLAGSGLVSGVSLDPVSGYVNPMQTISNAKVIQAASTPLVPTGSGLMAQRVSNMQNYAAVSGGMGIASTGVIDTASTFDNYGLNDEFLLSLGINGPLTQQIFIRHLDHRVNAAKLREVFSLAGKVVGVELVCDSQNKSKGYGFVEYEHPLEAVQAVSMLNNQKLFDSLMVVQIDYNFSESTSKLPEGLQDVGPGLGHNGKTLYFSTLTFTAEELNPKSERGKQHQLSGVIPAPAAVHVQGPMSINRYPKVKPVTYTTLM